MQENNRVIDFVNIGWMCFQSNVTLMSRAHRHNEIELNYVEHGAMAYLYGGSKIEINAGQLALFWATTPHQTIQAVESSRFYCMTIPFAVFLQWRLPETFVQQLIRGEFVFSQLEQTPLLAQFQQWRDDLRAHTEEHQKVVVLEVEALLRRVALKAEVSPQPSSTAIHTLSKVEQIACYIAQHYMEPLHAEDIASTVHLHPNYAMTLFRKHFGMSMMEYLTHYRIAHAQRLLLITDARVSEIALESGFGSVSRFYSVFKATCGILPNEYRHGLQSQLK